LKKHNQTPLRMAGVFAGWNDPSVSVH